MHITVETGDRAAWVTVANVFGGPSHLFVEPNSRTRFPASSTVSVREVLTVAGVETGAASGMLSGGVAPAASVSGYPVHVGGEAGDNSQAQMPASSIRVVSDVGEKIAVQVTELGNDADGNLLLTVAAARHGRYRLRVLREPVYGYAMHRHYAGEIVLDSQGRPHSLDLGDKGAFMLRADGTGYQILKD